MAASDVDGQPKYTKILEIGPIPPPRAGWGVRIEYLLKGLRERGYECAALDLGPNRKVRRPDCDDVQSGWDYVRKVLRYLRHGYRIHNHLNGESMKSYLLVLYSTILSWCFGRPCVLTWHGGLGYRWFPDTGNVFVKLIHRTIFGLSERIICNDDTIRQHIMRYGVRPEKVVPIPAFSSQYLEFKRVELPADLEQFLATRSPRFFCYVYFRPEFYLPVLVDALARLKERFPDYGIVIVGFRAGSEETAEEIQRKGVEEHVFFAGDLGRDEFLTLISKSDLCIRTHKRDGISSSVLEALALGVPVVATANPLRPPEVVTYRAEDSSGLVEAVCKVMALAPEARRPSAPEIPDTVGSEIAILTRART